jgi:TonB family protein
VGLNLKIEQPCHENWEDMELGLISRNCKKCDKAVYDFTNMSRQDILEFILLNQHQGFCGRFNSMRLDFTQVEIESSLSEILSRNLKPLQRELILSMAVVLLGACNTHPPEDNTNISNSIHTKEYIAGTNVNTEVKTDSTETTKKETYAFDIGEEYIEIAHIDRDSSILEFDEVHIKSAEYSRKPEVEVWMGIPRIYTGSRSSFSGGVDSLNRYIHQYLREEITQLDSGVVVPINLQFKITKRGKVRHVRVLNSNSQYSDLEHKVCKAIKKSKTWYPMRNAQDKAVNSIYTTTLYLQNTK